MSPKERERRLEQRVDRSHRRGVSSRGQRRGRRPTPWTMGEKAALVLSLAFIFAAVVLTVLLFLS
jgi:hypothetical protein